ncbi:RNA polymerase sigma factor [Pelagicoccus mobilis]|uniref:Sigma-70 family RNA polymerase sigma factor n=1 Tax=Pelagicoccus mobilis TaxID=415221 RepID=A0A934VMG2_9BACT|nr:sigma-70 family RNA polymerase sigma factor [Pelagicoccus mobilis]MBK1878811.1 sigma-70 family RNA polymerase sigma factor [Pelagicoccus mobilis]
MKRDSKQVLTELLVLRTQGGEERAFTQLYELWAKDVLKFASFVVKDSQAAEEIAQEGWVSVAKALRKLDDATRFRAWLFQIVRRRCIDWIRRRQTERKGMEALKEERASQETQRESQSEESAVLSEAIQKMDTDTRLLIHLFYESGLTVAEAAVALELPAGTVKSRLFAIREKLKKELERTLK